MKGISIFALTVVIVLSAFAASGLGQKLKPEEIVAKHLDSIGTAEARMATKTRMAVGDATVTFIPQKNQAARRWW